MKKQSPKKTDQTEKQLTEVEEPAEESAADDTDQKIDVDAQVQEETAEQTPLYELNPATYSVQPIGEANPKVVLLTIDDAPDKRALDMAKTLKSLNAQAIFFVNGHFIATDEKEGHTERDLRYGIHNR